MGDDARMTDGLIALGMVLAVSVVAIVYMSLEYSRSVAARAPKKESPATARTEPPKTYDISAERYRKAAEKLEKKAVDHELSGQSGSAQLCRLEARRLRAFARDKENAEE
jgi:hypothetical protein